MRSKTILGLSNVDKIILVIIPPILGAILGWFMPTIASWAIKIPFIPFSGVLEWIAATESPWHPIITVVLGVIAGLVFVYYAFSESLKITITDEEVSLSIEGKVTVIHQSEVSAIYMEGKSLVILNNEGNELFRGQPESKQDSISEAFRHHMYSWKDADPFDNQYQRWIADHPDFPPHINSLLSARERAIQKEETEEMDVLRKDLVKEGIVIRDEGKRQYVRMVRGERE